MTAPLTYSEFLKRPQPPAPRTMPYGAGPLRHVELWKPAGSAPLPVVLMIHGGCWQTSVGTATIMHAAAADLMARGIAVWSIEYRGIDIPGGGYPGTFADVAAAADLLAREGPALGLATDHVVALGHSAGGHLAFWLAARPRIAPTSALWSPHPLPIAGVVSLGGLPDLAGAATSAASACGAGTVERLVGAPDARRTDVYADTSPLEMAPLGVPQIQISGELDGIAPPYLADLYTRAVSRKDDRPRDIAIADAGHFELITPETDAWRAAVAAVEHMLQR